MANFNVRIFFRSFRYAAKGLRYAIRHEQSFRVQLTLAIVAIGFMIVLRVSRMEAVVLTLAAGLSGGVIGFTLAYLFVLEAAVLMEIPLVFTMPYVTFLATFAISLLAGAAAAYLPTRRLLRKPAAEILRLQV